MTIIPFTPSQVASPPFTTLLTLDGQSYTFSVAWNIVSNRWYFTLIDQNGARVITQPLIGSPPGSDIFLAPGLFSTSTLVYRVSTGNIEQTP